MIDWTQWPSDFQESALHPELSTLGLQDLKQMRELEHDYLDQSHIICNIPRIELDNLQEFLQIYKDSSVEALRQEPSFDEPWSKEHHPMPVNSWNSALWNSLDLYVDTNLPKGFGQETMSSRYLDLRNQFPRFYQQVFDLYPFKQIWFVKFLLNRQSIPGHQDTDWQFNCPTSFRSIIWDTNPQPTFWIERNGLKHYVDLPNNTNTFAYNNGTYRHGADWLGHLKIIMVVRGIPDAGRMRKIFEQSSLDHI